MVRVPGFPRLAAIFLSWLFLWSDGAVAAMTVFGAAPARHDRFYVGVDKHFIAREYDLSGIGKAVSSSSTWATMVSPRYFVSANHSHPNIGDVVRFHFSNDPADGYVDRVVAGGLQVPDNSGVVNGDLWLGYFNDPVPAGIARYPLLGSGLAYPPVGSKLLLLGKANDSGVPADNPTNQRVGRNICAAAFGLTYSFTYATPGTGDALGIDENRSNQGDSGAPTFVLVENQLALVGTRWTVTGDMNAIGRAAALNARIQLLSGGSEQLGFIDIPVEPIKPAMFEDFQAEAEGSHQLRGQPTTVKHELINAAAGAGANIVTEAGNQRLALRSTAEDTATAPKAFFETIADGVKVGSLSANLLVDSTMIAPQGKVILSLRAGDDLGTNGIVTGGSTPQALFQIDFVDDGSMRVHASSGVHVSDQQFPFDELFFVAVAFDTAQGNFEVYVDDRRITSSGGAVRRFLPMTSVASVDAVLLTAFGVGGVETRSLIDDIRLGPPGGWRTQETRIPLMVKGAALEADALSSGDWVAVPSGTGSILEITRGGSNAGSRNGLSVGGNAGLNVSEIEQLIDLSTAGYDSDIDAGRMIARVSAFGQSYQIGDFALVRIEFLDVANLVIGAPDAATVNDGLGLWKKMVVLETLPAGTRKIRLVVGVTRTAGVYTDAYVDGMIEAGLTRVETKTIVPLGIEGAAVEADAFSSGDWMAVPNATGSTLGITRGGANEGSKSGISTGGIAGFNSSEIMQVIELSSSGYRQDIDAGRVTASFSAFGQSFQVGDYAQIAFDYLDENDAVLGAAPPAIVNDGSGVWKKMGIDGAALPAGTRKIRLRIGVVRTGGITTDAYVDGYVEGRLLRVE